VVPPKTVNVQRTFKPGADNLVAGVIIGLLMIGGGSTIAYFVTKGVIDSRAQLPFWAEKGWCWGSIGLAGLVAIVLLMGGVILIWAMLSLSSLRIHVGDAGLSVTSRTGDQVFQWDQIVRVKETHLYERPPLLKGPASLILPKVQSKSYVIVREDHEEFAFNATSVRRHEELAEMIKFQLEGRDIPWVVVEEHA
jgi:hypothetical protein